MIARTIKVTTPNAAYHLTELREYGVVEPVPPATKPVRYRVADRLASDGIFRMLLAIAAPDRPPRGFIVELGPYVDELSDDGLDVLARRNESSRGKGPSLPALPD